MDFEARLGVDEMVLVIWTPVIVRLRHAQIKEQMFREMHLLDEDLLLADVPANDSCHARDQISRC